MLAPVLKIRLPLCHHIPIIRLIVNVQQKHESAFSKSMHARMMIYMQLGDLSCLSLFSAEQILLLSPPCVSDAKELTLLAKSMFSFHRRGNLTRAAQLLPDLNFLPLENFRLPRCTEAVPSLHRALLQRLPSLLVIAAQSLAATGQVRLP